MHLLPYLEEQELYRRFHLDEPWDSPHNKELVKEMPPVFRSPDDRTVDGRTRYLAVSGENTLMGSGERRQFSDVTDGLSNTAIVIQVDPTHAVPWTAPNDIQANMKKPIEWYHSETEYGDAQDSGFIRRRRGARF